MAQLVWYGGGSADEAFAPKVLTIGDSWFAYPSPRTGNLLHPLFHEVHGGQHDIHAVAVNGQEAGTIFKKKRGPSHRDRSRSLV